MTTANQRTFRWWPVDNGRHAIPGGLQPGASAETLCRHPVTMPAEKPTSLQWLWPTCSICYERARDYTHVALTEGYDGRCQP
ncbi:zinc finger protein [Goodfellowiella coeruleoviolacea]|uniref:Zinc-finger n=1 Tax=Goodfellowiella coeruleoviolacea TaxID=334858 RepID=A0AAE3GCK5_9PSEU|nr:zinc finger protein [Goodfellowiella coeruleoviolacea]MCP2164925.1 zinc-finger [Goodfellowiella coeruleoviolacea]